MQPAYPDAYKVWVAICLKTKSNRRPTAQAAAHPTGSQGWGGGKEATLISAFAVLQNNYNIWKITCHTIAVKLWKIRATYETVTDFLQLHTVTGSSVIANILEQRCQTCSAWHRECPSLFPDALFWRLYFDFNLLLSQDVRHKQRKRHSTILILLRTTLNSKQFYISFTGLSSAPYWPRKSKSRSRTVFHQLNPTGLCSSELLRQQIEAEISSRNCFTPREKWTPGWEWCSSSFLRQQKPTWESGNTKLEGSNKVLWYQRIKGKKTSY